MKLTKLEIYQIQLALEARLSDPNLDKIDRAHLEYQLEIILRGYEGLYGELSGIFQEKPLSKKKYLLVTDVFDMFRAIRASVHPVGINRDPRITDEWLKENEDKLKYEGWDFSNDKEAGLAEFLLKNGRWEELRKNDWDLSDRGNSHDISTKDRYLRMLQAYKTINLNISDFNKPPLSFEDLEYILGARANRKLSDLSLSG